MAANNSPVSTWIATISQPRYALSLRMPKSSVSGKRLAVELFADRAVDADASVSKEDRRPGLVLGGGRRRSSRARRSSSPGRACPPASWGRPARSACLR